MDGLVFTYDLEREDTLSDYSVWMSMLNRFNGSHGTPFTEDRSKNTLGAPIMILGNKADAFFKESDKSIEKTLTALKSYQRGEKTANVRTCLI